MSDLIKRFKFLDKLKKNKVFTYLIIISVIIIFFAFFVLTDNSKSNSSEILLSTSEQYVQSLEKRLSSTLSRVEGAGKVSVVINVESGMETILAMKTTVVETSSGKETTQTPLLVNGKTVVVKEKYPNIVGVLIVCEGAGNISVLYKIQQATVSLLNIELKQIEILTMK